MHRRGRLPSAAGRSLPGTSPTLALSSPQPSPQIQRFSPISNRLSRQTACRAGGRRPGPAISNRHTALSNRHLVQLEFTATRGESATSLFLIDPNQHNCFASASNGTSTLTVVPTHLLSAHPATPSPSLGPAISNRHLVQLEFAATHPESTTSLFLIDPNQRQFSRVDYSKPGPESQRNFFEARGFSGVG